MEPNTIGSGELGDLFEQASLKILDAMFQCWGFEIQNRRLQSRGTQFGFDIFYRLAVDGIYLNVFVECKASKTYNSIKAIELTQKVSQLSWSGFPAKDIHLFFSASRAIEFDNQTLSIQDNSHPFVIVDWMRAATGNPAMELFATYQNSGTDPDILAYCNYLFTHIDPGFTSTKTFEEVCVELRRRFQTRLAEHSALN